MSRPEFADRPPVLVEIGASGGTHAAWKSIARWSVCVAFDPDRRDMQRVEDETTGYKLLLIQPAAAVAVPVSEAEFHLTRAPHCSSLLAPNTEALADWDFAAMFDVERIARVPAVQLSTALKKLNIEQVDWFKTDSQGIDLRLFLSLGEPICRRVLAAEFEPGIIDAYRGEDKLSTVLASMDRADFWLADLRILGTLRISAKQAGQWSEWEQRLARRVLRRSPGWGEMTYLNTFRGEGAFSLREWLLGWVIATLHEQHGFALDIARRAAAKFDDKLFGELAAESERHIAKFMRRGKPIFLMTDFWQRLTGFVRRRLNRTG